MEASSGDFVTISPANTWTGVKLRGRKRLLDATWRCPRCYYLESHAREE